MKAIVQQVDFHVVVVQIVLLVLAAFWPHSPWMLTVLAGIPHGRILTRALYDYPRFKRPATGYLIVNEAVVASSVLICVGLWQFF